MNSRNGMYYRNEFQKSELENLSIEDKNANWYYVHNSKRIGPVSAKEIYQLVKNGRLDSNSLVWRKGFKNWTKLSLTAFATITNNVPPVLGSEVNNSYVWWLAFLPIIGILIENILSILLNKNISRFWLVTYILNSLFASADNRRLKEAGYNTDKLGSSWLVPVYLFKRAKLLNQSKSYAIVWCVTFALITFSPSTILSNSILNLGYGDSILINSVKNSHIDGYPLKTLGEAIDRYIKDAKWTSFVDSDNNKYVNVEGIINYNGKPAKILLQYKVNTYNNTYSFNAMEIDGEPQSALLYLNLIEEMFNANTGTSFAQNNTNDNKANINVANSNIDDTTTNKENSGDNVVNEEQQTYGTDEIYFKPYTNSKYGFYIEYPDYFSQKNLSVDDSGLEFVTGDNTTLKVYGENNIYQKDLETYYINDLKNIDGEIKYKALGDDWYVISWEDSSFIYYKKSFIGNGSINTFIFTYPKEQAAYYNDIVEYIEDSFKPGDLSISH
ncbi:protein of unknown function [Thermoanaerobacter thermohydrosulfuricus]|nr:protein of unknown function [Thermoanaerobacter thermohydrosulfuricus]